MLALTTDIFVFFLDIYLLNILDYARTYAKLGATYYKIESPQRVTFTFLSQYHGHL